MNKQSNWDTRYQQSEHLFGTRINQFLISQKKRLKPGMNALSIADGEAFNSIFLAELGLHVLSLDISQTAQEKARLNIKNKTSNVTLRCADILEQSFQQASFDVITVFFLHIPSTQRHLLHQKIMYWLKPGGLLLYECFDADQTLQDWMPKDKNLLLSKQQIREDFSELTSIHLDKKSTLSYEETLGEITVVTLQYAGLRASKNS